MKLSSKTYHTRKNIFKIIFLGILVSFSLYGIGITSTTLAVAETRGFRGDISDIQTDITNLEFEYLQMVQDFSEEHIHEFGFVEESSVYYAFADTTTTVAYNY